MKLCMATLLIALSAHAADDLQTAQQLLWAQRYAEAAKIYRGLLPDVDARKGLATAEYWSGDFRAAKRDFELVLQARPDDAEAAKAVADITAAMAPVVRSDNEYVSDDQPMRRAVLGAAVSIFSDPLTKWTAAAGTYALDSEDYGHAVAPFASIAVDVPIPSRHLRADAALRVMRFPDGRTQPLGRLGLARRWKSSSLSLDVDRHEILYTATAIATHPSETTTSLTWHRETKRALSHAAVHAISYFDDNNGRAADAYHLVRAGKFLLGASASYRDTDETRFEFGRYVPYWTPIELLEFRGIAAANVPLKSVTLRMHADAGWARDRGPFDERRTFHPWLASAEATVPLRGTFAVTIGVERQSTVFYSATAVRIGFSGRL